MKRTTALLLTVLLVLSLAACAGESDPTGGQTTVTTAPQETLEPVETVTVDNPLKSIYLSMNTDDTKFFYLNAYDDGMGGVYVEMQADVRKVATLQPAVLHGLADALAKSGLEALNGQNLNADGNQGCSVYAEYADGTVLGCSTTGKVTAEFSDGYAAMELYFKRLLQATPVYVPQPIVEGEVDETMLQEMLAVLNSSGIDALDSFVLTAVANDEFMGHTLGMNDTTHVAAAVACSPMIQPNAYSFVIVRVDDAANIDAVRKDLADNLNWAKWVCVRANDALIAQKGDLVLCLMGSGAAFGGTKFGIEKAGWENFETYKAD